MNASIEVILIAAGCTGAVGTIGIGALWLLRRASLRLSLQAASVIAILAVVAGTLGTANAMFISHHDLGVVGMVCVVAGVVAFGFSWLLGRQVEKGSLALRQAARSLGQEGAGFSAPSGPMAAELAALSQELAATAGKLRESRERERRMDRSRRSLIAWVSHDLRTPLAGLQAMAEALDDGLAADPGRYYGQIRTEVTRLASMVDDLFELSRIQSGTLALSMDRIEVGDLVSDTVASMEAVARARGVRLDGQAEGAPLIWADARELSRALANLVTNGIRHTPEGGRVRIEAAPQQDGVLITVADGCGGIPEADLESVFTMGWRGTEARTPAAEGGAGLGLAIVRGIVEAHRGRVSVANVAGGCRFEMRLPAPQSPGAAGSVAGPGAGHEADPGAGHEAGSAPDEGSSAPPAGLLIPGL